MVEGSEGGGPDSGPGSKAGSSFESAGGRLRFTVELRPGETTIVSWKKLLKEANASKSNMPGPSVEGPPAEARSQPAPSPTHEAPPPSEQPMEDEPKDSQAQPGSNRLSNVIERIERMYAGNGSGDEADVVLDDVPDDDEYDTEDSFIDDTELNDYFQVDNSSIKHDGFFINRGKLERIEPTISTNQQPKKRRREDSTKGHGGSDDGNNPNKIVKIGSKGKKASALIQRNSTGQSNKLAMSNIHGEDMQFQASPTNAAEVLLKNKTVDAQTTVSPSGVLNGDAIRQDTDNDHKNPGVLSSKKHVNKRKESELQATSIQRSNNNISHASKSHSGKQINNADGLDQSIQQKQKGGLAQRFDLNVPAMGEPSSTTGKEGSSVRPKSTALEKAIRELEKIVAQCILLLLFPLYTFSSYYVVIPASIIHLCSCIGKITVRPPSTEVKDPDNSSQAVKRRLPPEIKQKLGKVARLAQISYGKVPKDLVNRLMGIVGHLMQVRTLKRNLKVMANTGLSAKQEKDDLIQKMKREVAEMVKLQTLSMKSKVEQQAADDFQEADPAEKKALKRKHMDDVLENKICDLYDLYVERLEENSGPSVRRLFEELVILWPNGLMDVDGIKRAIYRAKDRRGLCNTSKDREKSKKRKLSAPKVDDVTNIARASHIHEKLLSDSRHQGSTLTSKPAVSAHGASRLPTTSANGPKMDKPKKEKLKSSSSSNPVDSTPSDVLLPKKKVKRKPNAADDVETQFRPEKMPVSKVEEGKKHHKQAAAPLTKSSNLQPAAPSGS